MEYSETLAEIIGIILGDGSLRYDNENYKYNLTIYLNGVDDYEYFQYVKNFLDQFFQTDIYEYWYKDSENAQGNEKGVSLTIYDKEIIHSLIKKGLIPGNKIENNISVPNWIKSDNSYSLRCLKGLIDTDGYIGVVETNNPQFSKVAINFTSKLRTLVNDFKEMSEKNR
ncbi:MAG: hypothetical protein EU535_08835 [Promethearchaeota archaeon]|nr:MAG: hypothetical protein EU535_08835 [Candidatus Lokiarchaeota archaeon]